MAEEYRMKNGVKRMNVRKFMKTALTLTITVRAHLSSHASDDVAATLPRPDPAVAEFARGVKFTVNGYQGGSEVQTNFPVLVRLSTSISGFTYSDFYADGSDLSLVDIGFVDAEGNGLAYDIDTWNTSGESLVWVNLPRMTNGTEFAMWYRSSKTGKELNAGNVWADYTRFVFRNNPRNFTSKIGSMTLSQSGEFSSWMVTLQLNYRF